MKTGLACAAALAAAMTICAPAWATIVDATFTGTIGPSSPDNQGIFGPAGNDLGGSTFVLTFEYDTTLGNYVVNNANEIELSGGTVYAVPTLMIFASVTINGITGPLFNGDFNSSIQTLNGVNFANNQVFMQAIDANQLGPVIGVVGQTPTGIIPVSIDTPQTITFDSTFFSFGSVAWGDPANINSLTNLQFTSVSSLVYSIPGPGDGVGGVPEPSTWAMMGLGFAALGYVGFRRRPASRLA
jgi:PEP-CTERM motif